MIRPMETLYSNVMTVTESDWRGIFINNPEVPRFKKLIRDEAGNLGVSSTMLMIRTLCEHYGLPVPERQVRPARDVDAHTSTKLTFQVPLPLWQAVHMEAGERAVHKYTVVLDIFRERFDQSAPPKKRKRRRAA